MSRALTVLFTLCFFHLLPLQAAPALASLFPQEQQQEQQQYQQQDQGPAYENFSRDQLDNLLSPVALYPDPLLAQLFVAATFPDQVEEAARFVRGNGPNGVDEQDWDVSVRAIAHYPTVIGMMADKIDWTTSLGQAYVNQSTERGILGATLAALGAQRRKSAVVGATGSLGTRQLHRHHSLPAGIYLRSGL